MTFVLGFALGIFTGVVITLTVASVVNAAQSSKRVPKRNTPTNRRGPW